MITTIFELWNIGIYGNLQDFQCALTLVVICIQIKNIFKSSV